jgi:hypothetical protein
MLLSQVRPDIAFAQWPIGTRPDHQTSSICTFWPWLAGERRFELFYYEANLGAHTMGVRSTVLPRLRR